jgi:hypothetical protein
VNAGSYRSRAYHMSNVMSLKGQPLIGLTRINCIQSAFDRKVSYLHHHASYTIKAFQRSLRNLIVDPIIPDQTSWPGGARGNDSPDYTLTPCSNL